MITEVVQTTVASIFAINSDKLYRIPKYQREYTWGKNDWNALFNDIIENSKGYFLGSFICVNGGALNGTILELIDGQQRFATLSLLIAALYSKLSDFEDQMDDDDKTEYANIRNLLAIKKTSLKAGKKKTEYLPRVTLQNQNHNEEDYKYILSNCGIITTQLPKPSKLNIRKIAKAFNHFEDLIDEEVDRRIAEDPDQNEIAILFDIEKKFESAVLVGIQVDTNKDAYMLFESLNHRGVPLSAIDLIKNTLISKASDDEEADDDYNEWCQILNNVGDDDYATQERFFRQYYNAYRDELNSSRKSKDKKQKYYFGYLATRTTMLEIYEKMIKEDHHKLLDDLLEKSRVYSIIVNNSEEETEYTSVLQDLARISGVPSYILLLYVMSERKILKLKESDIVEIIDYLIRFFVRRNITDYPSTRKLTQLFIDLVTNVKQLTGRKIVTEIKRTLRNESASDEVFEKALRGPLYDENPEATRFVLCSIESLYQTKEIYSDLWSRDNTNKYIWTIEHIFPEGEKIPSDWVKMIADGNKELAEEYREKYVHTLGNLTITGYNSNLSNLSFEKKKERKSRDGKKIGYRNGLFLNKGLAKTNSWTVEKIQTRTNKIVEMLMDMYSMK